MAQHIFPHHHGEEHLNTDQIIHEISKVDNFQIVADSFKILGDTTRIRIFWALCHCEECVINISAMMDMSSPAVSHHLRQLKSAGLIVSRREGKEVYYLFCPSLCFGLTDCYSQHTSYGKHFQLLSTPHDS